MRALIQAAIQHTLTFVLLVILLPDASFGQSASSAFRASTWGMSPAEIRSMERGHHLGTKPDAPAGLDRLETYFDVVRGKVGEIGYGFYEGRLVYGVYRFNLKARDRAFSQTMGEQLQSTYGPTDQVDVSDDGKVIQLHWSTDHTTVIARFAPTSLDIHFWDTRHRARHATSDLADRSER